MTAHRKAHLRVGVASVLALVALLLVGATRSKATVEPTAPAIATTTPTPFEQNPSGPGGSQQIQPRPYRHFHGGGGFGGGGGGMPDQGGQSAPSTDGTGTGTT